MASAALKASNIEVKAASIAENGKGGLLRLAKAEDQLPAKDVVRKALGDDYVVALNLAQTTPAMAAQARRVHLPMKLGLDLSGGVHFLLEVDMEKALDARLKVYEGDVKSLLRKERVRYRSLPQLDGAIQLGFSDADTRESRPVSLIRKNFNEFDVVPADLEADPASAAGIWR